MRDGDPVITVIIPARAGTPVPALEAARRLDYPRERLEILVVRGAQPSRQRNLALQAARGELVYFLDDDSLADPVNLLRAVPHFADPAVIMVGGPNLCPADAPELEQSFAAIMGTFLAFGPSRSRYAALGGVRATSEKELILCNLLARRESLLSAGGFDESLYPNEENALMDTIQAGGGKLLYDPALLAWRRPRRTWRAFARMLFTYGRGRGEQFRAHPTTGSIPNFIPPLFCLYLALLPALPAMLALPLALYAALVLLQAIVALPRSPLRAARVAGGIVLTHLLYGLGFFPGLLAPRRSRAAAGEIQIETASP